MATEWNGDEILKKLQADLGKRLEAAAIYLKGKTIEALNESQPYEREEGEKGIYYRGLEPSEPGNPPKKITGFLQRSIAHEMSGDKKAAFVGTNLEYGLWLEIGTTKMKARPYLRSTLLKEGPVINR